MQQLPGLSWDVTARERFAASPQLEQLALYPGPAELKPEVLPPD